MAEFDSYKLIKSYIIKKFVIKKFQASLNTITHKIYVMRLQKILISNMTLKLIVVNCIWIYGHSYFRNTIKSKIIFIR